MSPDALITMIVLLGAVWGGFTGLLIRAARSERRSDARLDRPKEPTYLK